MPLKLHPTDPDKMVYVKREYNLPKEWVGLTDEEIKACAKGGRSIGVSFHDAICRAEAKLKEKNT